MLRLKTAPSRVLVIISTIVVALVLLLPSTGHADGVAPTTTHHVRSGDSLWSIAEGVTDPGSDIRGTIEVIKELNGLSGSVIIPGQRLVIPSAG